ncbi:hypothetical protein Tco_0931715, partial [Tanacetum coccineum]
DGLREDKSTNIIVEKVRDYHSARTNQSYEERVASPIDHLKKLNNRVLFGLSASANISLLAWDLLSQLSNEKDIALLPPGASSEYRLRATLVDIFMLFEAYWSSFIDVFLQSSILQQYPKEKEAEDY